MSKRKSSFVLAAAIACSMGMALLTGCGNMSGENLEEYMKDQSSLRQTVDAQLNILSADAKATVQYTEDSKAEVTVQYYAMTEEEIKAIEPDKAEIRCKEILDPVVAQYAADTGNKAEVTVSVEGQAAE